MPEAGPTWFESELGLSGSDLIFVEAELIQVKSGLNCSGFELILVESGQFQDGCDAASTWFIGS